MNKMRPVLTAVLKAEEFKRYYWLKEELVQFCRENGLRVSGSKIEIADRVAVFLERGDTGRNQKLTKKRSIRKKTIEGPLTLQTVIGEHHRCSQKVREFFKSAIGPKFHFSTHIQEFFKNNPEKTYDDAVRAWHEEEERKKASDYKKEIAPQFEYNQFTRDFFADPANRGKTRGDSVKAWKEVKSRPGSNKYVPSE